MCVWIDVVATTTIEDWQLSVPCPSGYYKNDSGCELCPKGTYSNESSQASCVDCPTGDYTYSEGSVSVDQCYGECIIM